MGVVAEVANLVDIPRGRRSFDLRIEILKYTFELSQIHNQNIHFFDLKIEL